MNNNTNKNNSLNSKNRSLRLSTATPLQALGAKAARAAIIAQAQRDNTAKAPKADSPRLKKERKPQTPLIKRQLKSITDSLKTAELDGREVTFDELRQYSSEVCVINLRNPADSSGDRKYVFYPSSIDPDRLGSVSIYGDDVESECVSIRRRGHFFGLKIRSISVENGRRPFLDITFRA